VRGYNFTDASYGPAAPEKWVSRQIEPFPETMWMVIPVRSFSLIIIDRLRFARKERYVSGRVPDGKSVRWRVALLSSDW